MMALLQCMNFINIPECNLMSELHKIYIYLGHRIDSLMPWGPPLFLEEGWAKIYDDFLILMGGGVKEIM